MDMDSTQYHYRPAASTDAGKLARLHYLSHTRSFEDFAAREWIEQRQIQDYLDFWERFLEDLSERERIWTAWIGERLVGTVSLKELENSSQLFLPGDRQRLSPDQVCCLRLMYVDPAFMRQGLGRELMEFALSFMRDAGFQQGSLITHTANRRARKFYEGQGWQLDEIFREQVKEFFEEPEEMRKRARYLIDLSLPGMGEFTAGEPEQGQQKE